MLWEHEPQVSVSTAFSQLFQILSNFQVCFFKLNRNTEYMFSISLRKHSDEKKGKQLAKFDY